MNPSDDIHSACSLRGLVLLGELALDDQPRAAGGLGPDELGRPAAQSEVLPRRIGGSAKVGIAAALGWIADRMEAGPVGWP